MADIIVSLRLQVEQVLLTRGCQCETCIMETMTKQLQYLYSGSEYSHLLVQASIISYSPIPEQLSLLKLSLEQRSVTLDSSNVLHHFGAVCTDVVHLHAE